MIFLRPEPWASLGSPTFGPHPLASGEVCGKLGSGMQTNILTGPWPWAMIWVRSD